MRGDTYRRAIFATLLCLGLVACEPCDLDEVWSISDSQERHLEPGDTFVISEDKFSPGPRMATKRKWSSFKLEQIQDPDDTDCLQGSVKLPSPDDKNSTELHYVTITDEPIGTETDRVHIEITLEEDGRPERCVHHPDAKATVSSMDFHHGDSAHGVK